jgi:cytochrome P450
MLRIVQRITHTEWLLRVLSPLIGKFNPFLPEFRVDPYPSYRRLQTTRPVYFSPALRVWILSRYADAAAVLQDGRFSVDRRQSTLFQHLQPFRGLNSDFVDAISRSLLMLDPPDHTRLRRLVNKAFTPRVAESLRPRIQAVVDELLDAVEPRREMDLIHDFAYPLPVTVIAEMLGIPAADRDKFKEWSDTLVGLLDPMAASAGNGLVHVEEAYRALTTYLGEVAQQRRREPRDDLISALVAVEEQGDRLSETDLLALCGLILGAGHETTTNLIGNAVLALLRNPDERAQLQADPSLMAAAVEELLRYDSPVQLTDRVATVDCEIAGQPIRRGTVVLMLLGAANRDPAEFDAPDRLNFRRADAHHLSFSHGPHFCLGAALARAEAQIAIGTLLRRFPHFDGEREPKHWKPSTVLRGPLSLHLTL